MYTFVKFIVFWLFWLGCIYLPQNINDYNTGIFVHLILQLKCYNSIWFFSFDREEQKQCRNRMSQLETERDQVFKEIQGAESDKNT